MDLCQRGLFFSRLIRSTRYLGKVQQNYPFEILMIMLDPDVISQPIENICVMSGADSKVFRENIVTDSPLKRFFEIHASRPSLRCIQIPLFASHIALPLPHIASHFHTLLWLCFTLPHIVLLCLALPHIALLCLTLLCFALLCLTLQLLFFLTKESYLF